MVKKDLTDDNVIDLLNMSKIDEKTEIAVKLMIETGVNVSDLVEIEVKNVDPENNAITIINRNGKTGLIVSRELMKELQGYINKNPGNDKLIDGSYYTIQNKLNYFGKVMNINAIPLKLYDYYANRYLPFANGEKKKIMGYKLIPLFRNMERLTTKNLEIMVTREVYFDEYAHLVCDAYDNLPDQENPNYITKNQALAFLLFLFEKGEQETIETVYKKIFNITKNSTDKTSIWKAIYGLAEKDISYSRDAFGYSIFNFTDTFFESMDDKTKAWEDFHGLMKLVTTHKIYFYNERKYEYVFQVLNKVYDQMSDKEKPWYDIYNLLSKDHTQLWPNLLKFLSDKYPQVQDKQKAWYDIYQLLIELYKNDEHPDHSCKEAIKPALIKTYESVPDKMRAWNNILLLTKLVDSPLKEAGLELISQTIPYMPDRKTMLKDICSIVKRDKNSKSYYGISEKVTEIERCLIKNISNDPQTWNLVYDLYINDNGDGSAFYFKLLCSMLPEFPDSDKAWNCLHRFVNDDNLKQKDVLIAELGSLYLKVTDKQTAWQDILKFMRYKTNDKAIVIKILTSVYPHVPDKQRAWNNLYKLATGPFCGKELINALKSIYHEVPDKQSAWNDLCTLAKTKDGETRAELYKILSSILNMAPDQVKACEDMLDVAKLINT